MNQDRKNSDLHEDGQENTVWKYSLFRIENSQHDQTEAANHGESDGDIEENTLCSGSARQKPTIAAEVTLDE